MESTTRNLLADHLAAATYYAQAEVVMALRQPQHRLITVLKARSQQLREDSELAKELDKLSDDDWGSW